MIKRIRILFISGKYSILIVFFIAVLFALLNKASHDVQEWDEARNGVNAYEMLHNHDYVNLFYDGKLDTWNAKPPLLIWLIILSYKLFGYNEFALRLPSTLASIIFFYFCFKVISKLDKPSNAFFTCMILFSCKAVFGNHIGLTADFDCLLLLFLTASVYSFIQFVEFKNQAQIFLFALWSGLAFYTKGPASLILFPGFAIYLILKKQWWVLKQWQLYLAAFLFIFIVASWFIISNQYGLTSNESFYGSHNSIETMLIHDTFQRLTEPAFDITGKQSSIYLFFFEVLDSRLNVWNYIFYVGLITAIFLLIKKPKSYSNENPFYNSKMLLLSVCLISPIAIILTFAATKNNWYLAPIFMYVAYIICITIQYYTQKFKQLKLLITVLLLFTLVRQTIYLATLPTEKHHFFSQNHIFRNKKAVVFDELTQDIVLYLKWLNVSIIECNEKDKLIAGEELLFIKKQNNSEKTNCLNNYKPINTLGLEEYQFVLLKQN